MGQTFSNLKQIFDHSLFRSKRFPCCAVLMVLMAGLVVCPNTTWGQQTREFNLADYRTEVSPGKFEEDLQITSHVIMILLTRPAMEGRISGSEGYIEVAIDDRIVTQPDGKQRILPTGRLVARGADFIQATQQYLTFRQSYEIKWIRSSTPENGQLPPTPLQQIVGLDKLSPFQKAQQLAQWYWVQLNPPQPLPTPDPRYWPVSDIIEIGDSGLEVQINLRGGRVTILNNHTGKVEILPFGRNTSPDDWLQQLNTWCQRYGPERALELLASTSKEEEQH